MSNVKHIPLENKTLCNYDTYIWKTIHEIVFEDCARPTHTKPHILVRLLLIESLQNTLEQFLPKEKLRQGMWLHMRETYARSAEMAQQLTKVENVL